jgi:anti-anti-sigma regulatory factor
MKLSYIRHDVAKLERHARLCAGTVEPVALRRPMGTGSTPGRKPDRHPAGKRCRRTGGTGGDVTTTQGEQAVPLVEVRIDDDLDPTRLPETRAALERVLSLRPEHLVLDIAGPGASRGRLRRRRGRGRPGRTSAGRTGGPRMTVIPDGELMTLICDGCAASLRAPSRALPDAEVVWTLVSEQGWSGSAFATGPHRCPRCSVSEPALGGAGDAGTRTGRGDRPAAPSDTPGGRAVQRALTGATVVGSYLVVDLGALPVIDPDGLGLLVRARGTARDRGLTLCLAAPSRFVRTVLHTMRLDTAFPIVDSVADAGAAPAALAEAGAFRGDYT